VLLIPCPHCGPRAEIEFHWGGEAHVVRPGPHDAVSAREWADYLFGRNNPKGVSAERWRHTHGCRQWFHLLRSTESHEILASCPIGESARLAGAAE
jgi:sarcosine oxidase subunit delta